MDASTDDAATYHITIDAPPAHVLAVLRDLAAYPDWQDDISAVRLLRRDGRGLPVQAQLTVTSMGMKSALTLALEHDERTMRWTLLEGDFLSRNDAEYTVGARDGGGTELTLRQELSLCWQMPQSVTKHLIGRKVATTMDAVKRRAEETAPARRDEQRR